MPPATRPLAHLAVALCVGAAMSACAGTETRPDPSLAVGQRPANDAVAQLMRHVPPIYPAVLTIWTDRASQPESSLGTLARALNPTLPEDLTPLEAVGVTLAPGLAQRRLPPLQGLDRARPVIAGVFGVTDSDLFDAVIAGNILDPLEAPLFLHNRFVLPATDAEALIGSLAGWGELMGLRPVRASGLRAVSPLAQALAGPGLKVLMSPGEGLVRVDVSIQPVVTQEVTDVAPEMIEMITRAPTPWRAETPAQIHHLEGAGVMALYLNFDRFASTYMAYSTMELAQGMAQFPPELQLKLLAQGTFNALTIARLMHPRNRGVEDMTFSVEGTKALDVRVTQSLTDANRIAYEAAALNVRPRIKAQASAPAATLYVRRSWRELVRAQPAPTWMGRWDRHDFLERLDITGRTPLIYALLATPWRGLNFAFDAIQELDPDIPLELPHNLAVVLETFELGGSATDVVAGIAFDLPPGTATAPYRRLAKHLEGALSQVGLKSPLQVQFVDEPSRTRVLVGVGKTPDRIFAEPQGGPAPIQDFELRINGAAIAALLRSSQGPAMQLAPLFEQLGALSITDRAEGGCLASRVFVTLSSEGAAQTAPEPIVINDPRPAQVPEPMSEGEACLVNLTNAFEGELGNAATENPDALHTLFQAAQPRLEPLFACARGDRATAAEARLVESGWYVLASRVLSWAGEQEQARSWAKRACEMERQAGCALAE